MLHCLYCKNLKLSGIQYIRLLFLVFNISVHVYKQTPASHLCMCKQKVKKEIMILKLFNILLTRKYMIRTLDLKGFDIIIFPRKTLKK